MTTNANTVKALLEDITIWTTQLAALLATKASGIHAIRTDAKPLPGGNPVHDAVQTRQAYATRLQPLADLAHEWATIRKEHVPHGAEIAYLRAHNLWASLRPGYDIATAIIAETHAWIAHETGNGPEQTDHSCPHCLTRPAETGGGDVRLVRYPTDKGYSQILVCPQCSAMHTAASLQEAWKEAVAGNDLSMPAEWIRHHWNINPATWRKWKQRGKIRPDENGDYPLNEVRQIITNNVNID